MTDRVRAAVVTVVHGRHRHLTRQQEALARTGHASDDTWVVALADPDVGDLVTTGRVVDCGTEPGGLPMSRARNLGAQRALAGGADLLIFLDVDCLPGPSLIADYVAAHRRAGDALLCGPVTYLPAGSEHTPLDSLADLTDPHPARPAPQRGKLLFESNYDLFWSLSFAVSAETWRRVGGFCEDYVGYGGEDTDFAACAAALGVPMVWVGGAHAYHQYHRVSDPPVEHLRAIVANARVFRRRWNRWPMAGWLDAFERSGLLTRTGDRIALTKTDVAQSYCAGRILDGL